MSSVLLFWIGLVIGFIVVELLTATFYGLSLSLAAGIVVIFLVIFGDNSSSILQAFIFAISSGIFAFILPKYLVSHAPSMRQGMEGYIGEVKSVKKVGGDMKVSLDGVDYLIESKDVNIVEGDLVRIIGSQGVSMKVEKTDQLLVKK